MSDLSASEIEDVREVFDLFDFWDGRDGLVDAAKVGDLLRCTGLNPTNKLAIANGGTEKFGDKQYKFEEILPIYKTLSDDHDTGTFADFMEGFKTFDREGQGYISSAELRNVMTMMGEKLYKFEDILPIYKRVSQQDDGTFVEYKEGFKTFDREGHGFISMAELRHAILNMGERMSDTEVDQILKYTDTVEDLDGNIKYEDFIKKVMAGPDAK